MEQETEYVSAPLLSIAEAAKELGVGKKIIYQLIENGEIRAVKPGTGKTVLIEKKSLDEYRAAGRMP
jgi:excisionase family DNA binding protein